MGETGILTKIKKSPLYAGLHPNFRTRWDANGLLGNLSVPGPKAGVGVSSALLFHL